MIRVATYVRVSTPDQHVENQAQELRRYVGRIPVEDSGRQRSGGQTAKSRSSVGCVHKCNVTKCLFGRPREGSIPSRLDSLRS